MAYFSLFIGKNVLHFRMQEERAERHRIKNMYQREGGKATRFEAPEPKVPGFLGLGIILFY